MACKVTFIRNDGDRRMGRKLLNEACLSMQRQRHPNGETFSIVDEDDPAALTDHRFARDRQAQAGSSGFPAA